MPIPILASLPVNFSSKYEHQVRAMPSQSRHQSSPCDSTWPHPPSAPVIAEIWLRHCTNDRLTLESAYTIMLIVGVDLVGVDFVRVDLVGLTRTTQQIYLL